MEQSATILEIAKALSKMQGEMKSVPKDSTNPFFKMRYASIDAVWDTIRKPLSANGLSVIQTTYEQEGKIFLETMLLHTSGEWFKGYLPINAIKSDPQAIGSAITYARRYSLSAILGVSADDDDDGEEATGHGKDANKQVSQKVVDEINKGESAKEHYCLEHKTEFFMRGKMKSFAHPIKDAGGKDTGEWCHEPTAEHKEKHFDQKDKEPEKTLDGLDDNTTQTLQEGQGTAPPAKTVVGEKQVEINTSGILALMSDARFPIKTLVSYVNSSSMKVSPKIKPDATLKELWTVLTIEQRQHVADYLELKAKNK